MLRQERLSWFNLICFRDFDLSLKSNNLIILIVILYLSLLVFLVFLRLKILQDIFGKEAMFMDLVPLMFFFLPLPVFKNHKKTRVANFILLLVVLIHLTSLSLILLVESFK